MKLMNFPGLDCYTNSVVTIAGAVGVDFVAAFGALWSETEFRYSPFGQAFVSIRLLERLAALGLRVERLPDGAPEEGDFFVVGMNAFHTPWNPYFGVFEGPHHFVVRRAAGGRWLCYDPTYGVVGAELPPDALAAHVAYLDRVSPCEKGGLALDDGAEIRAVARATPATREQLLGWFGRCVGGEREDIRLAARYVAALIGNRRLYRHYLRERAPGLLAGHPLDDDAHYEGWVAVKNGLYKAALLRGEASVIREVQEMAGRVLDAEGAAALSF